MPGEAAVLLPPKEGATDESPVAYRAPLPADCHGAKTGVFLSEVRDYSPLRDCVENEEGGVNCASTVTHLLCYDIEHCNTSQQITSVIFKKRKGQFRICSIHLMQPLTSQRQ